MIVVVVVNSVTLLTLAASLTAASAERLGMYSVPPSDDQILLSGANMQSQSKFSADWGHSGRLVNENGQHKAANGEMIEAVRSRALLASGKKHKKHPHPKAKSTPPTPPKVKPPPPLVTSLPPQPISPPQKSKPPPPKANSPSQHSSQKKSSSPSLKHPPPAKLMSPSPQIITTPNSQALAPAPAFGSASPPSSVHTSPPQSKSMYPLPSPPPSITSKSPLPPITVTQPPSVSSSSLVQPYYSSLYSSTGESQTGLNSRLMDWSYAGYQAGSSPHLSILSVDECSCIHPAGYQAGELPSPEHP
ncbi:hypothetical protein CEUSTIGMA_g14022.t1, partial [Chlamydomonas eustigma]